MQLKLATRHWLIATMSLQSLLVSVCDLHRYRVNFRNRCRF